ncbi:hypothetical protein GGP85_002559 [Salinibacter ruber]|uniref:hypothetical protein n=1 Tax=Salinibacter ruber TaxID=146919 RepID=UPI00216A847C|nr:hypothetical protein [Salinibacter ruber]MCS3827092.1 hypothetical protein [Salinibacter ruber]
MDFRFIVRRTGLLLFAGLFGFATLQPATAQNSHEVTVNVEPIQKLSIKNDGSGLMLSDSFIVPLHEQLRRQMEHPF